MIALLDTYKYYFWVGDKVVRIGVAHADDLERREQQLRQIRGWGEGRIEKVGEKTTRDAALAWEMEEAAEGMPAHF